MPLKLRSIEPRRGLIAKAGRRLMAVLVRFSLRSDERYLADVKRTGVYGEPEFRVLRLRIQAQMCRLIYLEG